MDVYKLDLLLVVVVVEFKTVIEGIWKQKQEEQLYEYSPFYTGFKKQKQNKKLIDRTALQKTEFKSIKENKQQINHNWNPFPGFLWNAVLIIYWNPFAYFI